MKLPEDLTILIVEDNKAHARLVDIFLKEAGFDAPTRFVHRGDDAWSFLFDGEGEWARSGRHPLLVFLDLNLPGVHGHEILRKLRSTPETARIPVIIVTSAADPDEKERCLRLGADAFILKPPTPEALRETFAALGLLRG